MIQSFPVSFLKDVVRSSFKLRFKADGRIPPQPSGLLGRHQQLSRDRRERELATKIQGEKELLGWGKSFPWAGRIMQEVTVCHPARRGENRNYQDTLLRAVNHLPCAEWAQWECWVVVPLPASPQLPARLQGSNYLAHNYRNKQGEVETSFF